MKALFQNIFFKMGVILVLILILLIPAFIVQDLIHERMYRQKEAVHEVSSKHADSQEILGPILTIPYKNVIADSVEAFSNSSTNYFHLLPENLDIKGTMYPKKRNRGLFEVIVYAAEAKIEGYFSFDQLEIQGIDKRQLMLNDAFLTVGISDLKGVRDQIDIHLGDTVYKSDPGVISGDIVGSGVNTRVQLDSLPEKLDFMFDISVNGSEEFTFVPIGKETNVHLNSSWKDPSFDGKFLPNKRKVNENGFSADWKVLHINRNYPQGWTGDDYKVRGTSFGVKLQLPVDVYQKSMRVAKYAILFIVLTFLVFFFVEILNKILIHPIQYILVGLALVLFYVLLLAFSEQIVFDYAYILSAVMTISLILFYCRSILKSWALAAMTASILTILYAFIFILIQIQDYALLFGSLGIFLILAITMYFSRKIDWFEISKKQEE